MHWFFLYSFVAIWKRIEACIIDANPGEISARIVRLARKSKTLTKNGRWLVAFRFLDGALHLHGLLSVLSLVLVAHLIYCSIMRSATPHSVRTLLCHSLSTLSLLFLFCSSVEVFAAYRGLAIKLTKRTQIAANDCTKAVRESTPGGPPAWLELLGV